MLARTFGLGLLAAAGLAAQPAAAQTTRNVPWVVTCTQHSSRDGSPYYASRGFVVTTDEPGVAEQSAQKSWTAFVRQKYGISSDYGSYCGIDPLRDFAVIAEKLGPQHVPTTIVNDWSPDFGARFEMPKELYYYCTSTQFRQSPRPRIAVTDLFKMPARQTYYPTLSELMGEPRNKKQGVYAYTQSNREFGRDDRCILTEPEAYKAYVRDLNDLSQHYDLVRNTWRGPDAVAAPNLIDDLAARAKYAKLSVGGLKQAAEKAPPPKAPPARPGGPPPKQTALTVTSDPSIEQSKKNAAEALQRSLKKEADDKAKIAALKAKDDAELKAKMDAYWAERRRQGNKQ
jgi:hypothetical protein